MTTAIVKEIQESGWLVQPGPRVFSGHESFPCRYGWLPKLYEAVVSDPNIFACDDRASLELGMGRNMVKSLRFWGEAFGITRSVGRAVTPTDFAGKLLNTRTGLDSYLETPGALWRLHWNLTVHAGLGAWWLAFLEMRDREITREKFVASVRIYAARSRRRITLGTASNHVNVFLRTYAMSDPTEEALEETLGSPLQELELIRLTSPGGIPTIQLSRGPKQTLDAGALAFVLFDFWQGSAPTSKSLSLRSLMLSHAAPGSVLLLDEPGLYERIENLCFHSKGLVLRSDGLGGFDLTSEADPLGELKEIAWP